jgi:hypothetical protein
MNQALEYVITVLLVAVLGILVKLYSEHVEDRIKVNMLWNWWIKNYGEVKDS